MVKPFNLLVRVHVRYSSAHIHSSYIHVYMYTNVQKMHYLLNGIFNELQTTTKKDKEQVSVPTVSKLLP